MQKVNEVRSNSALELHKLLCHAQKHMRVAVVYSGCKTDPGRVLFEGYNTRPWKSYEEVANNIADTLKQAGFLHVSIFPEGVDLLEKLNRHKIDVVWINSGGVQGIDPVCHLPALLEMAGIPYIGHNPANASILDNKHFFKWGLVAKDIATAPFLVWNNLRGRFTGRDTPRFQRNFADYDGPFIVKPISGRGSVMVEVIDNIEDLADCIEQITQETHNPVLIEKYLTGAEYTVAVCGEVTHKNQHLEIGDSPMAFSQIRRNLDKDERIFTSMDVKPITNDRFTLLDPKHDKKQVDQLIELAHRIFIGFNLETLVRIDIRADENGKMHVIEANPKPDLKRPSPEKTSLVGSGLQKIGMTYDDLILSLFAHCLHNQLKRKTIYHCA